MSRIVTFAEDNPWLFLIAAGFFAYEALESFRTFFRLNVIREANDITKEASDV